MNLLEVMAVLQMSDASRQFLQKNLPEALNAKTLTDALDLLFDLIEEKGFAPPEFEWYNDFGREAQQVYDDLYLSNT